MPPNKSLPQLHQFLTSKPWAILPEKLDEMLAILEARDAGLELQIPEAIFGRDDAEQADAPNIVDGIQVIKIDGTITPRPGLFARYSGGTSTQQVEQQFLAALANDQVAAIFFDIDSPGGSVFGVAELARTIFENRGKKRIAGHVNGGMAASAAYWIGSAIPNFSASESSQLGSIGVVQVHVDATAALEKSGRKYTVLRSARYKHLGGQYETLTQDTADVINENIGAYYGSFLEAVARQRSTTVETVLKRFGEGKMFTAADAVERGMLDSVKTREEVLQTLRSGGGVPPVVFGRSNMDAKVKAALVARGIVSAEASEEMATVGLNAFFTARGAAVPEKEADQLAAVLSLTPAAVVPAAPVAPQGAAVAPVPPVDPAAIAKAESDRHTKLIAKASLLNQGGVEVVSAADLQAAITGMLTPEAALDQWTEKMAKQNPEINPTRIEKTGDRVDALIAGATDAIVMRLGGKPIGDKPHSAASEFYGMRLSGIAREALISTGADIRKYKTDEEMCAALLSLTAGGEKADVQFAAGGLGGPSASAGPTYGPGQFPDLMSNIAGKLLGESMPLADATYREWTKPITPVTDFKPKTIINTGAFGLFSHILDGDEIDESTFETEKNWLQVDRYGDKVKLTPIMMANDDLDVWSEQLQALGAGAELTINQHAVNLLTGNVVLPDGYALFSAEHNNIVTGGGGPSIAQSKKNRLLMRGQKDVSNKLSVRYTPAIALTPTSWETEAEQHYLPSLREVADTDANVNTFRGKIKPIPEPMLDDASTLVWYALADPMMAPMIRILRMLGYEMGRMQRYYDPKTQCLIVEYEIRFGVGVSNFRSGVQNPGT